MEYAFRIENLTKSFMGMKALDCLSLEFPKGQTTGLIGSNGSGKSTLINILTGFLYADSGSIEINEKHCRKIKAHTLRDMKIVRTFQEGRLIEQISVEDNLLLAVSENRCFRSLFERSCKAYKERLDRVLEATGLTDVRNQNAETLSYPQRKMLEVARCLMTKAEIYFFDESFSDLQAELKKRLFDLIMELKEQQKTIIIAEHDLSQIKELCDYVVVMDGGEVISKGVPEYVLQDKNVYKTYGRE